MPSKQFRYYLLHKPYGYLSQFTPDHPGQQTLAELCQGILKDVFPVGRLDKDSEGLLLLTNDKRVNHRLLDPAFGHRRTYWAQVEGMPTPEAMQHICNGVVIKVRKAEYTTLPCQAAMLLPPPQVPKREPPIRFRKSIPDTWVEITLTEGKNRQVRRMFAAVGFPVLRLIRTSVEDLQLGDLPKGVLREISQHSFYEQLNLRRG